MNILDTNSLEESIFNYALNDNVNELKILLDKHPEFDINIKKGKLLIVSARNGALNSVKYLVSLGMDIHSQNDNALRWAANNNNLNVVKYLIELGADVHAQNEEALRYSSFRGHTEVVEYLLAKGADLQHHVETMLKLSIDNKYLDIFKVIVEESEKKEMPFIIDALVRLKTMNENNEFEESKKVNELINWTEKYMNAKLLAEKLNNEIQFNSTQQNKNKI